MVSRVLPPIVTAPAECLCRHGPAHPRSDAAPLGCTFVILALATTRHRRVPCTWSARTCRPSRIWWTPTAISGGNLTATAKPLQRSTNFHAQPEQISRSIGALHGRPLGDRRLEDMDLLPAEPSEPTGSIEQPAVPRLGMGRQPATHRRAGAGGIARDSVPRPRSLRSLAGVWTSRDAFFIHCRNQALPITPSSRLLTR